MSTMTLSAKGGGDFFRLRFWAAALLMLGMFLMLGVGQANAAPLAGTSIGNQASATYLDSNSVSRITVSNTVSTIVQPVGSATLTQSQTKTGAPGQPLAFPHTLTNNGNAADTFTLTAGVPTPNGAGAALPATLASFYADANCDGVADNSLVITTVGPVAPGSQACFVASVTLNTSGATPSAFTVSAASALGAVITNNTDTAQIATAGVVNISKAISSSSGAAGSTPITYTLTYRNTGTQPVFGLVIADTLQSGVVFAPTVNARFNGTAVTSTGAISGTTPNRINVDVSTNGRSIVAVIERVDPNTQGTFSFDTTQNGPGPVNNNNAQFCYLDGTSGGSPYAPGTLPTTIQPPNAGGTAAVATACAALIGNATAGSGSGVLSIAGTPSATYSTAGGVLDTNVTNATAAANPNTTNTVPFNVLTTAATGVLIANNGFAGGAGGNGIAGTGLPVDGNNPVAVNTGTGNDVNTVASAAQGSVVSFSNWVWNTGTASDAFNVTALANNFPAGTSFLFMRGDGNTPLTDSDGDGVVDTGPIPGSLSGYTCPAIAAGIATPNATASAATPCGYRVVVRAILPPNATGTNLDVVVRFASSLTPATVNTVQDRLAAIAGSTVDLKNPRTLTNVYTGGGGAFAAGCTTHDLAPTQGTCDAYVTNAGNGQTVAGEAASQTSIATNPATSVRFKLDVNNTGAVADSFDVAYNVGSGAWTFNGTTNAFNTPAALPTGYTLGFYLDGGNGDCSTLAGGASAGQQITNTGVIQPANRRLVCAVVNVPAGAAAGAIDLYFRVISPTTATANAVGNAVDVIHDQLFINTARSVIITPNNSGQIFPGGSIQYCHTVTNAGNVGETAVTIGNVNSAGTPWPANATLYRDLNNNCVLDAADTAAGAFTSGNLNPLPLAAGAAQNYIVVVQAPAAATAGQTNITTITVTPSGTINGIAAPAAATATDSTIVVTGQVSLVKSQVLDATCATAMTAGGVGALTYSTAQITTGAIPGACIVYRVVATNIGTQNVSTVQIFDTTPPNTTCLGTPFSTSASTPTVTPSPAAACVLATTAAANIQTSGVTLTPNDTVNLYFRVRINP